jgi:hypothetical protein
MYTFSFDFCEMISQFSYGRKDLYEMPSCFNQGDIQ